MTNIDMEQARQQVIAITRDIGELGGLDAFMAATEPSAIVAGVKQRLLEPHLDSLGPPGGIAFDPYQRSFELRGHRFEADFVGSFGGGHWLWSWANAYLPLQPEHTAFARRIRAEQPNPFTTTGGILFGEVDAYLVQHRMGALAIAVGGADAAYVANHSQTYALAAGQIPGEPTLFDLNFSLNDLLFVGLYDPEASIRWAAERLGFDIDAADATLTLRHRGEVLTVELDGDRISSLEHRTG